MSNSDPLVRTILIIIALILLIPLLIMIVALPMMGMWGGGHMWGWNGTTGIGWVMLLMWLVPLAVVLGIGYILYRGIVHAGSQETDVALEELRIAYARGDLSDEEFEQRRRRLQQDE